MTRRSLSLFTRSCFFSVEKGEQKPAVFAWGFVKTSVLRDLSLDPIDRVATSSYIEYMKEIKTVGIKTLKDNLSSYLRDVKGGALLLVTDRGRVVAELKEPDIDYLLYEENSLMKEWIRNGSLIPARKRDQKSTRLNSSHIPLSRMPSSA